MDKINIFKRIAFDIGIVASFAFSIISVLNFLNNMNTSKVSAQGTTSSVHSIKNINSGNYNEKIAMLDNIDNRELLYKEELSDFYGADAYVDMDGSIYMYDKEGNLISYTINEEDIDVSSKITKERAIELADDYLVLLVDNISDYVFQEVNYDSYMKEYNVIYGHHVCGLKTSDIVYITIGNDEELKGYSTPNIGKFNDVLLSKSQIETIKKQGLEKFCQKRNYNENDFKVTDAILILENNEIAVDVAVEGVVYTDNHNQKIIDSVSILLKSIK